MLQKDHALFRSLFGQASVGMVTADPEHRLVHCNRAFCDMLGYGHDEIIGLRMANVASAQDVPHTNPEFARPTGQAACYEEWQFRRKDGTSFVGAVLSCKLPDEWLQAIVLDFAETNRGRKDRYFSNLEKRFRDASTAREA
jgi:PAS domain S-box-containing protein